MITNFSFRFPVCQVRNFTFVLVLAPAHLLLAQTIYPDQPHKVEYFAYNRNDITDDVSVTEEHYTYNKDGQLLDWKEYRGYDFELSLWAEGIIRYTDGRLSFSEKEYYYNSNSVERTVDTDYFYYDGCLVKKLVLDNGFNLPRQVVTLYDSTTCQILSEEKSANFSQSGIYTPTEKTEWMHTDSSEAETYYQYLGGIQEYRARSARKTYFDELGRTSYIINRPDLDSQFGQTDSTVYYYRGDSEIFSLIETYKNYGQAEWYLIQTQELEIRDDSTFQSFTTFNTSGTVTSSDEYLYINRYDEDDLLIESESHRTTYDADREEIQSYSYFTDYHYDCEERLKESVRTSSGGYIWVFRYYYDDPPCEEASIEYTDETLKIYPNPATEYIDVQADLLRESGVQLELIQLNGKATPLFSRDLGIDRVRIPIQYLSIGVYAIRARVGDKILTSRFIKN